VDKVVVHVVVVDSEVVDKVVDIVVSVVDVGLSQLQRPQNP